MDRNSHINYILQLADNALVLGHRNSEWTGYGPILEQDIALSNIALDLIGQARYLYQHAAKLAEAGGARDRWGGDRRYTGVWAGCVGFPELSAGRTKKTAIGERRSLDSFYSAPGSISFMSSYSRAVTVSWRR
jgi:hypothetical protein